MGAGRARPDAAARDRRSARAQRAGAVQRAALRGALRRGVARHAPRPTALASVYDEAQRWLRAGCFESLVHDLRAVLRLASDRAEEPSAVMLDSRTLRSTPEGGARAAWDGHKRTRGSKLHAAVDTLGQVLALHVTPAHADDRSAVAALSDAVQEATGDSVDLASVDQGDTGERAAKAAADHGIVFLVVSAHGEAAPPVQELSAPAQKWRMT
ncbi:transposase [Methylobacterium terricola]|uniref:Transposase n=1 Tax=Methylobacterium terricola TaxID=2583531 RepID=A0A5C4LJE1_9HYPH|nr:transposase [Methylobacterium terricola]